MPPSSAAPSSRLLALEVLCRWHETRIPVNGIFDRVAGDGFLDFDHRDLQLANALVFGVLRQQQYLDHILTRFAKHPLRKMKPRTLFALRIGLFQILLLDRVPDSAAVNETVKAFKAVRQPKWLINFVNGVLRTVVRNRNDLPTPEQSVLDGEPILNHPDWLVRRWRQRFGREKTITLCRCNNRVPLLTLRAQTRRIDRDGLLALFAEAGIRAVPGKFSSDALSLPDAAGSVTGLPGYEQGYFQVQDEAAQLASRLVPMADGYTILDACAGLGGKTGHLAAMASPAVRITAVEPDAGRYRLLRENLLRLGFDRVTSYNGTLEEFAARNSEQFDALLLDAPCSGTGVIRRQPDIRWNRREEDLQTYRQQQLHLLETAVALLKTDGVLVYATCSLEPEENEGVVRAFLERHPDFSPENVSEYLPSTAGRLVDGQGYFHPTPADGLDGFFAARLRKA